MHVLNTPGLKRLGTGNLAFCLHSKQKRTYLEARIVEGDRGQDASKSLGFGVLAVSCEVGEVGGNLVSKR